MPYQFFTPQRPSTLNLMVSNCILICGRWHIRVGAATLANFAICRRSCSRLRWWRLRFPARFRLWFMECVCRSSLLSWELRLRRNPTVPALWLCGYVVDYMCFAVVYALVARVWVGGYNVLSEALAKLVGCGDSTTHPGVYETR